MMINQILQLSYYLSFILNIHNVLLFSTDVLQKVAAYTIYYS